MNDLQKYKSQQSESQLHQQVANYIKLRYPQALFNVDLSGLARGKNLRSGRGFPDIVIYEIYNNNIFLYHSCFIELKKECTELYKKNGEFKTKHFEEQYEMFEKLRNRGYYADFAIGFDQAKEIIDWYMENIVKS